jgi:RecA-family ATPase
MKLESKRYHADLDYTGSAEELIVQIDDLCEEIGCTPPVELTAYAKRWELDGFDLPFCFRRVNAALRKGKSLAEVDVTVRERFALDHLGSAAGDSEIRDVARATENGPAPRADHALAAEAPSPDDQADFIGAPDDAAGSERPRKQDADDIARMHGVEAVREMNDGLAKVVTLIPKPPPAKLPFINMSRWDDEPVPEQEWSVPDRYPLRQTVLFTGEGAAGKGTTKIHLCAAHALARDWLGTMPEPGPAMFVDAEDDEKVMHIRLAAIANHYGVTFKDIINGGLHLTSLVGDDAVLGSPTRGGLIEPTARYKQLLQAAGDIKPKMIAISSAADVFAGDENSRPQVRQFITMLNRVAILANGTVALIAHPSLTGINSGSGLSGSTQWHNSVRARAYMTSVTPEASGQPETDHREIVFKKNQYGPISARIVVKYQNGMFLPMPGVSSLDKAAREQQAEDLFLKLLRQIIATGQDPGQHPNASNYAPTMMCKHQDANGFRKAELERAMHRLLNAGKIHVTKTGPKSKERRYLALGPAPSTNPPINDHHEEENDR